jgi:hypothetical protein
MQLQHMKVTIASAWVLTATFIGVVAGVTSIAGALVLGTFGLVPPLVLLLQWNEPEETLSESIHEALKPR